MPLDPNIILATPQSSGVDANALFQQQAGNAVNMMKIQTAMQDRAAAETQAQQVAAAKAMMPSVAAAFQDSTDQGLDNAASLMPPEVADTFAPFMQRLKSILDLKTRQMILRSELAKDEEGRFILSQLEPTANMRLQADTAANAAALRRRELTLQEQQAAQPKVAEWVTDDAGNVTGLDAQGNVVATQPGIGKKTAVKEVTGPDGVKLKPGERMTPEGTVEAVPGSETFNKQKAVFSKDYKSATAAISELQKVRKTVEDLKSTTDWQKAANTGVLMSRMPNVPGVSSASGAYDFQTKYNNLKGSVAVLGRAAASLQGKLGNMAVQEWKTVSDAIANLDLSNMDTATLNSQLDIVASQIDALEANLRDAYDTQYSGGQFYKELPSTTGAEGASVPTVTSDADYEALPSGAEFIDPEGNRRRKP